MNRNSDDFLRRATLLAGGSLIAATLLFSAVFVFLARTFGYPDVLDLPASQVLPQLLALGSGGRAVWVLYGLIPLLLLPTAMGVYAAGRHAAPLTARVALILALLSAVAMMVGLLRWPSLHWHLALAYADASPAAREAITAVFAASNIYLGNFVGEFLGLGAEFTEFAGSFFGGVGSQSNPEVDGFLKQVAKVSHGRVLPSGMPSGIVVPRMAGKDAGGVQPVWGG